ncbi:MAG: hypothetical protein J6Y39_05585 [Bacteroidaceae bacterium]|nr:hypothetical protein [Bacteroidaceae bacterium]
MVTKVFEEEKSLRDLILRLSEGMTVYGEVNRNFVPIKVSFSQCAYLTAITAIKELQAYIADLDRDICREPLCLDLDEMGSEDCWKEKLAKLRSDMTELEEVPLLQKDLVWGYKGFFPNTTAEFYQGAEEKVMELARLISQVQQKMAEKPLSFYGKFYHDLRVQYCEEQAVKDFKYWQSHSGIPSLVKLKMLRAEKIADFINSGILRLALKSCDIEQDDVDVEQFKKQLPHDYACVKDFDVLCTVFSRTIGWQGDILIPNYNCAGLFIFQHWVELTEEQINAIFYLDKMLKLIHEEIQNLPEADSPLVSLPDVLATPEAMRLWRKAQKAGYVDEQFQPLISKPLSAVLAAEMARRLDIRDRWKPFELLWNRKNMFKDYYEAQQQKRYSESAKMMKELFD